MSITLPVVPRGGHEFTSSTIIDTGYHQRGASAKRFIVGHRALTVKLSHYGSGDNDDPVLSEIKMNL